MAQMEMGQPTVFTHQDVHQMFVEIIAAQGELGLRGAPTKGDAPTGEGLVGATWLRGQSVSKGLRTKEWVFRVNWDEMRSREFIPDIPEVEVDSRIAAFERGLRRPHEPLFSPDSGGGPDRPWPLSGPSGKFAVREWHKGQQIQTGAVDMAAPVLFMEAAEAVQPGGRLRQLGAALLRRVFSH